MTDFSKIGFPSTHLLYSIAARNLSAAAICGEVADNAFGAAAGNARNLMIEFSDNRALFIDDGRGMADIWKLFELGGHYHDPEQTAVDIGQFGQGAKDAFLSLGWTVRVETVRDGVYHKFSVDWRKVAEANSPTAWPIRYEGAGVPAKHAPNAIRGGGTLISVTQFHEGRRLPTIDALRVALSRIFKPALRDGRRIHLKVGKRTATLDTPDIVKIDDRLQAEGQVNGMPFTVMAGALLEHSPVYNSIFYGFGHRVLSEEKKLCSEAVPPLFTADVQLGAAWKPHLQTNKLGITAYKDELEAQILSLVKELWDTTKSLSDEARLTHINARLERFTAKVLQFRPSADKTHDRGKPQPLSGERGGDESSERAGTRPAPIAKPKGTEGGAAAKRPRASGIKFRKLDEMDEHCAVSVISDDESLEVRLNGSIEAIDYAYSKPFKIEALWPTISHGITEFLLKNPGDLDYYFPGYAEILGVNIDDPDELRGRLFAFLMKEQPKSSDAKGFEPKLSEIA